MISDRVRRWAGILSGYFAAQGLVQGASLLAGLLFVNFMPMREFALYTLASSFLTSLVFLSDLGATSSLLYFFRRQGTGEPASFPEYVAAVHALRRTAFSLAGLVMGALFLLAARAEGFSWASASAGMLALLAVAFLQIDAGIRVLTLRLQDRYGLSYRAELAGSVVRLGGAALLVGLSTLKAWLALGTGALAAAATTAVARPGRMSAAPEGGPTRRQEVLRFLLPTLPGALYFAIQGPLVIWLAASFGGTQQIAEVGALGRLGLVMSLFSGVIGVVFLPRLARVSDDRLYLRRYVQFGLTLLAPAAGLVALAAVAPAWLLWLIGHQYAGLGRELVLVVLGAGLTLLGGFAVGVNNARSWTRPQGLATLTLCLVQVGLVAALPLDSTIGVLLFGVLSASAGLGLQLLIAAVGFVSPGVVAWRTT